MKCRKCAKKAVIGLARHHTAFCRNDFIEYCESQVRRAIEDDKMFTREDRILVAVSGGKDSLALWDLLLRLGYQATGLHVDLGIGGEGGYSGDSLEKTKQYAARRGVELIIHAVPDEEGGGIIEVARAAHRATCSACGTIKRYQFNRIAAEHGFTVVATGHNLDDEAARLLGNLLHWQWDYLAKQSPALPEEPGWVRKVKPFYRLAEREAAAYAVLAGIEYIVEECPLAVGSKLIVYKEILNRLEEESPGSKQQFYLGFLRHQAAFAKVAERAADAPGPPNICLRCGQPTSGEVCTYCRLVEAVAKSPEGHPASP